MKCEFRGGANRRKKTIAPLPSFIDEFFLSTTSTDEVTGYRTSSRAKDSKTGSNRMI